MFDGVNPEVGVALHVIFYIAVPWLSQVCSMQVSYLSSGNAWAAMCLG